LAVGASAARQRSRIRKKYAQLMVSAVKLRLAAAVAQRCSAVLNLKRPFGG